MITLQAAKPLHIRLPRVYRYMQQEFVDQFFETGALRISSFDKFRRYPDEVRGDKSEGGGSIRGEGKEGFQFILMTRVGENGYMLSSSLTDSADVQGKFANSGLVITDPLAFSAAVMTALPGVAQAFLGFCNYQPTRVIEKEVEGLSVADFTGPGGEIIIGGPGMAQRTDQMIGSGIDLMFLKESRYQDQAEFRFVWTINARFFEMHEHLDIVCKEAVQFCERRSNAQ